MTRGSQDKRRSIDVAGTTDGMRIPGRNPGLFRRRSSRKGATVSAVVLITIASLASVVALGVGNLAPAGPTNPWDRYGWILSSDQAMIISGGGETGLLAAQEAGSPTDAAPGETPTPVAPTTSTVVQVNAPDPPTTQQTTQSETSVAVSGTGTGAKLVIGFNDATICCRFPGRLKLSGFSFSVDGGATWTDGGTLPNPPGDGFAATIGDPAVVFNPSTSRFYYATLMFDSSGISLIGVSRSNVLSSSTTAITFDPPVVASTNVQATHFQDKEYIAVDPSNGFLYVSWTDFAPGGGDAIRVARSTDGGATFEASIIVGSGAVQGSIPAVDPVTHQVYVSWEDFTGASRSIMISRSDDFGQSFGSKVKVSDVDPIGNSRCSNGRRTIAPLIRGTFGSFRSRYQKARVLDLPTLAVDPANDNVYVAWNNQEGRFGSDILFSRSTDAGATFSDPIVANSPRQDEQFQPWLTSPAPNKVSIVYLSIRAPTQTLEVNLTQSTDGGLHFGPSTSISAGSFPFVITDRNFDPIIATCYMGDYIGLTTGGGTLYSAWGDNRNTVPGGGRFPFPSRNDPDVFFTTVS